MKQLFSKMAAILSVALLMGMMPLFAFAETATAAISGFDAARGEGQLIIYTPAYGATTATNEWGAEATVGADHRVTAVGGNNSAIPAGGFVVSGHDSDVNNGKMKTWVLDHIEVGDYVYYNERTLVLTVSDEPLSEDTAVFYEISHTYTNLNGTRYENDMIVYNSARGSSTDTNEFGYEVTVENGIVTVLGGNNSAIPKDGFVVSGHGTSLDWLRANVTLGMRAELDQSAKTVKFIYDAAGLEGGLTAAINRAETELAKAKENFLYVQYDVIEAGLADAKQNLADAVAAHNGDGTDAEFAAACDAIDATVSTLRSCISESYTVQYRAVWVRPSQSNAAEVDAYVKTLHDAGINTVCVEGNFNNGVIMTTPSDCLFQRISSFKYDVLQAYIDACHRYGMECHLWMAVMEVGHSQMSNYSSCVTYKKPEWLSLSQKGTPDNPDDFMMIDPANEEAREYIVNFYEWIVRNYEIDCFELDYIRYYAANGELDFGYTQAAFEGFEATYGHGVTPTYDTGASYWNDWVQYRKDCVSEMVKAVREMIDRVAPEVLISADVVADPTGAGTYNYQDYLRWLEEGWLDMLHPMAYGDGYGDAIEQQVALGGERCMVVTGLGVFMDSLGAAEMVRQAIEDNTYGAYGDCYFEGSTYLQDKAGDALLQTVYRNDAIPPFLDPDASLKGCLEYMQGRIDDVLLPLEGLTEEEGKTLTQAITAAGSSVSDSRIAAAELQALHDAIAAVANETAKEVLESDLLRTERIICTVYDASRDELTGELELPEGEPAPEESSAPEESKTAEESTDATVSDEETEPTGSSSFSVSGIVLYFLLGGLCVVAVVAVIVVVLIKRK